MLCVQVTCFNIILGLLLRFSQQADAAYGPAASGNPCDGTPAVPTEPPVKSDMLPHASRVSWFQAFETHMGTYSIRNEFYLADRSINFGNTYGGWRSILVSIKGREKAYEIAFSRDIEMLISYHCKTVTTSMLEVLLRTPDGCGLTVWRCIHMPTRNFRSGSFSPVMVTGGMHCPCSIKQPLGLETFPSSFFFRPGHTAPLSLVWERRCASLHVA